MPVGHRTRHRGALGISHRSSLPHRRTKTSTKEPCAIVRWRGRYWYGIVYEKGLPSELQKRPTVTQEEARWHGWSLAGGITSRPPCVDCSRRQTTSDFPYEFELPSWRSMITRLPRVPAWRDVPSPRFIASSPDSRNNQLKACLIAESCSCSAERYS